jgi:hypothetical protein
MVCPHRTMIAFADQDRILIAGSGYCPDTLGSLGLLLALVSRRGPSA